MIEHLKEVKRFEESSSAELRYASRKEGDTEKASHSGDYNCHELVLKGKQTYYVTLFFKA